MDIERTLREVVTSYPTELIPAQVRDIPRVAFQIALALNGALPQQKSVCDIGGGFSLFSCGCAALGMNVMLIDDFDDDWYPKFRDAFDPHRKYGVSVIRRDVIKVGVS